jgi:hypothetical protein
MYGRSFKLVIPITLQGTIRSAEKSMAKHFGGVTAIPIAKGYWVNKKGKIIEDENLVLSSARDYTPFEHPQNKHREDQTYMEHLAQRLGRTTRQKYMMLEEDLVGTLKMIEIHRKMAKRLEKVV